MNLLASYRIIILQVCVFHSRKYLINFTMQTLENLQGVLEICAVQFLPFQGYVTFFLWILVEIIIKGLLPFPSIVFLFCYTEQSNERTSAESK